MEDLSGRAGSAQAAEGQTGEASVRSRALSLSQAHARTHARAHARTTRRRELLLQLLLWCVSTHARARAHRRGRQFYVLRTGKSTRALTRGELEQQALTATHTRTHARTHTNAHAPRASKCSKESLPSPCDTHTHTLSHTHARTHARTHVRTHTLTPARALRLAERENTELRKRESRSCRKICMSKNP